MFNENSRVKIPAIIHLTRLGYKYTPLDQLEIDPTTNIIWADLRNAIGRYNPGKSQNDVELILSKIRSSIRNEDLGQEFFKILTNTFNTKLLDFKNAHSNEFRVVTELEYSNMNEVFRPDVTIFINGLPLAFVEVKKPNNPEGLLAERDRSIARSKNPKFNHFLNLTQLMIFSNNMEYLEGSSNQLQGAYYSTNFRGRILLNPFNEEEPEVSIAPIDDRIIREILTDQNLVHIMGDSEFSNNLETSTPTNRMLTSLLKPDRFLFFLKYGIAYVKKSQGLEKHIMRYPQFFASRAILQRLEEGTTRGIIWHTQGSGKTALAYYATNLLQDFFQDQGKIGKFYFIVDRLDLLNQAKAEFESRDVSVKQIESKQAFIESFSQGQALHSHDGKPEITVTNIQKFAEETDEIRIPDYGLNVQRVYFIDEAHRSYNPKGSFLERLLKSDPNAILLSLTGTPLIGDFASTKIFGGYIHRYFYNSSIADGYTLRLIREGISANFSTVIEESIAKKKIEKGALSKADLLAHPTYVRPMVEYIRSDLVRFRKMNSDDSLGGMVICDSSDQARAMFSEFMTARPDGGHETAALILHDEGTKDERNQNVEKFKAGKIDLLFVFNMLLTGFDAPRLKKLYIGRVIRDHNLLQALTRVNRPYKGYKYGYIVDFADIRKEYADTNSAYLLELENELGADAKYYSEMFLSEDEISESLVEMKNGLFGFDLSNKEIFSRQISAIQDLSVLSKIKGHVEAVRDLSQSVKNRGVEVFLDFIDYKNVNAFLGEISNRIALVRLHESVSKTDGSRVVLNEALEEAIFSFYKVSEEELSHVSTLRENVTSLRHEIEANADSRDLRFVEMLDELKRLLGNQAILELDAVSIRLNSERINELKTRVQLLNRENSLILTKYSNDKKYLYLHKALMAEYDLPPLAVYEFLNPIRIGINNALDSNRFVLQNRGYFMALTAQVVAEQYDSLEIDSTLLNIEKFAIDLADEYFKELMEIAA